MAKKIVYVDMDNTIVDFKSGIKRLPKRDFKEYNGREDEHPYIFTLMDPIKDSIESVKELNKKYDLYVLSTAPWENSNAWKQKRDWLGKYFGESEENPFYKKVILSHNKNLNSGDYLIDDRPHNGAENFKGEWIRFGSEEYPDWKSVTKYLL
tara:strand:+ start:1339 stop:1794 length:456 start_codon:yes stop_codon:yes gene_type:complete